jgi:hypothetical protein
VTGNAVNKLNDKEGSPKKPQQSWAKKRAMSIAYQPTQQ